MYFILFFLKKTLNQMEVSKLCSSSPASTRKYYVFYPHSSIETRQVGIIFALRCLCFYWSQFFFFHVAHNLQKTRWKEKKRSCFHLKLCSHDCLKRRVLLLLLRRRQDDGKAAAWQVHRCCHCACSRRVSEVSLKGPRRGRPVCSAPREAE